MGFFSDETTQGKLVILYFLASSNLEVTDSQITTAALQNEWTDYFSLQQSLQFLRENGFVALINRPVGMCYVISASGRQAVDQFASRLPQSLRDQIDAFISANRDRFLLQVQNIACFEKISDNHYLVKCKIAEGNDTLIEIQLDAPSRKLAAKLARGFEQKGQCVYGEILKLLSE